MIRVEKTTVEQINIALQAIETLARGGGSTTPAVIRNQLSTVNWANIINKPATFPPSDHADATGDHTHEIADVNGLSAALASAGGGGGGGSTGVSETEFNDHKILNLMGIY